MRAYQIHSSTRAGCPNLSTACPGFHRDENRLAGGKRYAMPGLPGRAKRFHPYPPSRRRRR